MTSKILLIDAENIDCSPNELQKCFHYYEKVYIIFANVLKKITFNTLACLCPFIKSERLNFIKMENAGKNSADMGLAFIAGKLSAVLEKGSYIEIRSKDRGFSNIISMLNASGFNATQEYRNLAIPLNHKTTSESNSQDDEIEPTIESLSEEVHLTSDDHNEVSDIPVEYSLDDLLYKEEGSINNELQLDYYVGEVNSPDLQNNGLMALVPNKEPNIILQDVNNVENIHYIFNQFHRKANITDSKKVQSSLFELIKTIRNGNLKINDELTTLCNANGSEECTSTILFNCIYLYYKRTPNKCFRGQKGMVAYFCNVHNMNRHAATHLYIYMTACDLISLRGKYIRTKNGGKHILPILKNLVSPSLLM